MKKLLIVLIVFPWLFQAYMVYFSIVKYLILPFHAVAQIYVMKLLGGY